MTFENNLKQKIMHKFCMFVQFLTYTTGVVDFRFFWKIDMKDPYLANIGQKIMF